MSTLKSYSETLMNLQATSEGIPNEVLHKVAKFLVEHWGQSSAYGKIEKSELVLDSHRLNVTRSGVDGNSILVALYALRG